MDQIAEPLITEPSAEIVNAPVCGMTPVEIVDLLRRAYALQPGAPMPGTQINPTVSGACQREAHRDTGTIPLQVRTLDQMAAAMGEPVDVPATLGEIDLLNAQAVLRGALLDLSYVDWFYRSRRQGTPVNAETVAAAVKLVTDAEKAALERDVQRAERKFQ